MEKNEYQLGFDHGTDYMQDYMKREGMLKIVDGVLKLNPKLSLVDFKAYLVDYAKQKNNLNNLKNKSTDSV